MRPLQKCDLVMKGGITSGIVYPPVILQLKDRYILRKIGGTSAGAIAATIAAAAEYCRDQGGFEYVEKMGQWLGSGRNLRNLFQPERETRPLMTIVDAFFPPVAPSATADKKQRPPRRLWSGVWRLFFLWWVRYPVLSRGVLFGLVGGMLLAGLCALIVLGLISLFDRSGALWHQTVFWSVWLVLGLVFGLVGLQIGGILHALRQLPQHGYGICSGYSPSGDERVLMNWLARCLDGMLAGGRETVLTFGDLKRNRGRRDEAGRPESIELSMVTTNLSQGRPYVLPNELKGFIFCADEMRRYFPEPIVAHMVQYAGRFDGDNELSALALPEGYHFLPEKEQLPVLVAMRLSLSFPLLLSALPFYTIRSSALQELLRGDRDRLEPADLQQNWFSDGGICSNFPIEFFDSWFPHYPTFGINLLSLSKEHFVKMDQGSPRRRLRRQLFSALDHRPNRKTLLDERDDVHLPHPQELQDPEWNELEGIDSFLSAVIGTGLGYRDTLQAALPSYRERIVQIRLSDDEGGMNLNMPPATIKAIVEKGRRAGQLLTEFDMEQHRWVRFQVLMAQLEQNLSAMNEAMHEDEMRQLFREVWSSPDFPYQRLRPWCENAETRLMELHELVSHWRKLAAERGVAYHFSDEQTPRPRPVMRLTTEL